MFDKLSCILCLENISDRKINIDSDESQAANIRDIIKQHFKEEVLTAMPLLINKVVCRQCWELVHSFHAFYVRVQSAHLAASITLKSLQELEIPFTEIKAYPDAVDELASPPTPLQRSPIELDEFNIEIYKNVEDSRNDSEFMPETVELTYSTADDSVVSNIMSKDVKNSLAEKKKKVLTEKKPNQKRKEKPSVAALRSPNEKQRLKTREYDEFIEKNFKLTCFLCQKSLTDFRELKLHYREEHKTNGYVKCCGKKLLKRGVLVDHIRFHNDPEYFKCEHCDKVFCDRGNLESHLKYFHASKERTAYKCEICSKEFYWRKVLVRHYQIHSSKGGKTVKCTECEKTFGSEYNMKQHLNLYHLRLYSKICDICGKSFTGGEAFRRHQREHSNLPRSKVKCEICGAELLTKNGLAQHIKAMHTEEYQKPQTCSICSKISPSLRAHTTHFRYMHATEEKHVCKICDKAFKRPNNLREHMATHTREALYTCTFCPQTFKSNANMYKHRKRKHPKEWSEKCLKTNMTPKIEKQK
ncbi:unnamed protein product [Ceratitis capitata]|uniref:(Mediterranean fruit fly) hypothetical protein n=2 Tax=Ceratitis capitata TaxID=7213 RepID=A0A811VCQ6_CERCA|nr:unnamed protein product [Ceratitis capitata]